MEDNTAKYWFSWFYEKWEKNAPGELIEQGLTPSQIAERFVNCLLYTSPSPRDISGSRMPSSA